MTLLEERPEAESTEGSQSAVPAATTPPETWLDTSDHKRLGLLFVYASLLFVIAGGVVGLIIGAKQVSPGFNLASDRWLRLYGLHTQMSILLFLTALWIGLATYVVPLQIGAGRLALPRLLATGFWTYLVGGGCLVASYIVGAVNTRGGLGGITQPHPLQPIPGGADTATVGAVSPGAGSPSGSIQFHVDGSNFGSPVTLLGSSATSDPTSALSVGPHSVIATYSGNGNFNGSGTVSIGGVTVTQTLTGTEQINPDCTGNVTYSQTINGQPGPPINITFVVSEGGDQIDGLVTDAGNTFACKLSRTPRRHAK